MMSCPTLLDPTSPSTFSVRVLFFAQAREVLKGTRESSVPIICGTKGYTAKDILDLILTTFPALTPLKNSVILARNQTYLDLECSEEIELKPSDELAVIPPISAG